MSESNDENTTTENVNTTTDNTNTQQHSYPTVLKDRLQKRKKKNKKPYSDSGVRRKTPISSMIIPKKDENINNDIDFKKDYLLIESTNIINDYLNLNKKILVSKVE